MRFLYEYRTSDNVRREGVVAAPNRDAAFAALKARGIRPARLDAAPGFLNWLSGLGKRGIAIILLVIIAATSTYFALGTRHRPLGTNDAVFDSIVRRQVVGDAAVIEKGVRTGWSDVFALEGDRFIASFAIPGISPAIRSTTEGKLKEALKCSTPLSVSGSVSLEARQVIAIVAGIKSELNAFLTAGGSIRQFANLLVQRQEQEIGYYTRAKAELETAKKSGLSDEELEALWEKRNNELRAMGIKLLAYPD